MASFVLVPGGWRGGWTFRPVTERLRDRGHTVYELTLSGVGERSHLRSGAINLDTHIEDVVRVFEQEDLRDAILVGHSYGGMVIAGVADRMRERIERLVYLDAYVPDDGDSCFTLTTPAAASNTSQTTGSSRPSTSCRRRWTDWSGRTRGFRLPIALPDPVERQVGYHRQPHDRFASYMVVKSTIKSWRLR